MVYTASATLLLLVLSSTISLRRWGKGVDKIIGDKDPTMMMASESPFGAAAGGGSKLESFVATWRYGPPTALVNGDTVYYCL